MQGLILAAGMGRRLKELTSNNTKCMVKVNGIALIDRMLHQLQKLNLTKVVIVAGYEGQKLKDYIKTLNITIPITFVDNPVYDKTNNIYSLGLARKYLLQDDTILLESDLIFEDSVLEGLVNDPRDTLALVDKYESWMDGTVVTLTDNDHILSFIPGKDFNFANKDQYYKTVNLYKFSKEFSKKYYVPFLEAYSHALGNNEYYEQVLRVISFIDVPCINAKRLNNQKWYEIDDIQDLKIASTLFASDEQKVTDLQSFYGGYWRYPKLLDFCYLVNPYYPPKKLIEEMKSNFTTLLTQYPSGMNINSMLAAKNFGVKQDYIVVGNGASELIKATIESKKGKIGFIRPTFEEYSHRCDSEQAVVFHAEYPDFSYTIQDIMDFYLQNPVETIVLINPDNPSGNYISKDDLLMLADWCEDEKISLILDESFVDFAEADNSTLLENEILEAYPHMTVVKSISKSYGIPGVRLGILASANKDFIDSLKKDVAIWNINSYGEFYMQIATKYQKDYNQGLKNFYGARKRLLSGLSEISYLRIIPTQANFVMCEVKDGKTSDYITRELLSKYELFIKDLSNKVGDGHQYVRIAVRTDEDNKKLLEALKSI